MRKITEFIKTTVLGGFLVLLPIVAVLAVAGIAVATLIKIVTPIVGKLPIKTVGGLALATVLAVLFLLVFCFLAGLLVRMRMGQLIQKRVENLLLQRLPGYVMFKNLTRQLVRPCPGGLVWVRGQGRGPYCGRACRWEIHHLRAHLAHRHPGSGLLPPPHPCGAFAGSLHRCGEQPDSMGDGIQETVSTSAERIIKFFCQAGKLPYMPVRLFYKRLRKPPSSQGCTNPLLVSSMC